MLYREWYQKGFLFVFLLFLCNSIYTQGPFEVKGQVFDSQTFTSAEGMNVFIDNSTFSVTDAEGHFSLTYQDTGSFTLLFLHENYEMLTKSIDPMSEVSLDFMVFVNPSPSKEAPAKEELQEHYTIKGQVIETESGKPLSNVKVCVECEPGSTKGGLHTTYTDAEGRFSFTEVRQSPVRIVFKQQGYVIYEEILNLTKDRATDMLVFLKSDRTIDLPEFVVEERLLRQAPYISSTTLSKDFEQSAVRDVGELLRSMPNVGGIRRGGANIDPVVRGFKFSQINVVIDGAQGVEGGCPNRMDPTTSRVEAEDIERIEVFKGPYALRYGTGLGGTINLVTRKPGLRDTPGINVKGLRGYESNWGGHKEHLTVEGGNEHAFFQLSGSRWEYGNYQSGDGGYVRSAFTKNNYGGTIGGSYDDTYALTFSARQSFHRVLFPALPMDEVDDNALLLFAEFNYTPRNNLLDEITIKGYQADIHHVMDNMNRPFSDTVATISDVKALTTGAKAEAFMSVLSGRLIFGLDYQNRQKDGLRTKNFIMQPMAPVKLEDLWNNAVIDNYAAYLEYSRTFDNYDMVLAARYDHNRATSDTINLDNMMGNSIMRITDTESTLNNFSFSGGLTRHFGDFSVSLAGGRVSRSPDMLERFIILLPVGFDPYDYMGNPQLKPEINNQADLTFRYNNPLIGPLEVNFFYSHVENFIYGRLLPENVQAPFTIGVIGVKEFYNADIVNITGFELAHRTPDNYDLQVGVTASYAHATLSEVTHYVRENNQVVEKEILYDDPLNEIPPFEGTLNVSYNLFNGKLVPNIGMRYVHSQERVSAAMYEATTPSYTLFNARLSYNHNQNISLHTGVNNLFDTHYYDHLNRRMVGTAQKIYEPGRIFYVNLIFNL